MPNNLPPDLPAGFFREAHTHFDRAARLHVAWRASLTHADKLDGARRTLIALDDTIRELTACREALMIYLRENR